MIEQIKQALIKETERHIAQDILYDDVYVGPFTEKDGVDTVIISGTILMKNPIFLSLYYCMMIRVDI